MGTSATTPPTALPERAQAIEGPMTAAPARTARTERRPGADRALLLATMAVWGLNITAVKLVLERQAPMPVAAVRMIIAAVFLSFALRAWMRRPWPRLARRQWLWLAGCGALMIYANQILFTEGVLRTTAVNAALILALNPLVAALLAAVALRERPSAQRLVGVALGFGGVAAVVLHRPGAALGAPGPGDLLMLASVVTWIGGGAMVQRVGARIDSATISWVVYSVGATLLVLHLAIVPSPLHWAALTLRDVALLLFSGLLSTGVGALVWNRALVTLGVARTALYAYWVPIFGVLFAVLVLGEPVTVWHGVGLAGVLGGTWLGTRRQR